MRRLIKPPQPAEYEYTCDVCRKNLKLEIEGLDGEPVEVFDTGLDMSGNFGITSGDMQGTIFNVCLCSSCSKKAVAKINEIFPDLLVAGKGIEWDDLG